MDINGFLMVYIPLEVGVIVAWHGVGGIGIGSGICISGFFGALVICTVGRLGWNIGFRNVTILAPSCLVSFSLAFLAFFLDFLDLPTFCIGIGVGSGTMMVFGGSGKKVIYIIDIFDLFIE